MKITSDRFPIISDKNDMLGIMAGMLTSLERDIEKTDSDMVNIPIMDCLAMRTVILSAINHIEVYGG